MHVVHKYPVYNGPKIIIQYHMIDAMENISSQKETVNNRYVAQHIERPSKS